MIDNYSYTSDGLRIFRNPALSYASHPRIADHLRDKLKVVVINNSKRVVFTDRIYEGSPFTLNHWFSVDLTDAEVLANAQVESTLMEMTGLSLKKVWA
jgi:hypothetical protein